MYIYWDSLVAQMVKNLSVMQETWVQSLVCNSGDLGSIPGQGDPQEKGMAAHSNILAWRIPWTEDPGGLQSWASLVAQLVKNPPAMWETWVRSLGWEDPLEKGQANHSSGRRQWHPTPVLLPGKSHGQRSLVGWNPWGRKESDTRATSPSLFTFMHWRRKWQPTLVFLPKESQGPGSVVGCRLWGRTESDTTEVT